MFGWLRMQENDSIIHHIFVLLILQLSSTKSSDLQTQKEQ